YDVLALGLQALGNGQNIKSCFCRETSGKGTECNWRGCVVRCHGCVLMQSTAKDAKSAKKRKRSLLSLLFLGALGVLGGCKFSYCLAAIAWARGLTTPGTM